MSMEKFNKSSQGEYLKRTNKNEVIQDYLSIGGDAEDAARMTKTEIYEEMVELLKSAESKEEAEKPADEAKKKKSSKSKRKSTKKSSKKKKVSAVKKDIDFDTLFGDTDPLQVVFNEGILVKVDSHCWWGKSSRVPKSMLNDAPKEILKGVQTLIDKERIAPMNSLRQRGERVVVKNGFSFIGLRGVYFVPKARVGDVESGLVEVKDEFEAEKEIFLDNLNLYKREWAKVCKKEGVKPPPDEWYPDKYEMRSKFKFDWLMFPFSPPSKENGVLSERQYSAEIVKQKRKMAEFLQVSLSTLAVEFEEIITKLNKRLADGETIRPKTLSSLRGFVETFSQMNVTGNADLASMVARMDKILGSKSAKDINKSDKVRDTMATKVSGLVKKVTGLIDSDDKFTRSLDF